MTEKEYRFTQQNDTPMLTPSPTVTFVIMGASGDLTKRKLIPALYKLVQHQKLDSYAIIGVALTQTTAVEILESAKPFIPHLDDEIWQKMVAAFYYYALDFNNDNDYTTLSTAIAAAEKKHALPGNRLFYLATMPEHFATITNKLATHGIVSRNTPDSTPWSRIVYEKPFGDDLMSARAINEQISHVFDESQVFRIVHYLGKEIVGNISLIRFTNLFFQPLWNKDYIDSIEISINEKIGIEGRGEYYDRYGVLKDVVQNHLLQLLALVAMEPPKQLSGEDIRSAKAAVLKDTVIHDVLLGQYEGYRQEAGVPHESQTPTFAALKLSIDNDRWSGVPIFLKTGKCLAKKEASIHIKFKQPPCLLMQDCPADSNYLTISIEPEEGFFLEINAKVPGINYAVTPVKMDFCHSCLFGPNTAQAYEVLLADAIRGDQSVFVRSDEIEHAWQIVDNINLKNSTLHSYASGSTGPRELQNWSQKMNIRWRS